MSGLDGRRIILDDGGDGDARARWEQRNAKWLNGATSREVSWGDDPNGDPCWWYSVRIECARCRRALGVIKVSDTGHVYVPERAPLAEVLWGPDGPLEDPNPPNGVREVDGYIVGDCANCGQTRTAPTETVHGEVWSMIEAERETRENATNMPKLRGVRI